MQLTPCRLHYSPLLQGKSLGSSGVGVAARKMQHRNEERCGVGPDVKPELGGVWDEWSEADEKEKEGVLCQARCLPRSSKTRRVQGERWRYGLHVQPIGCHNANGSVPVAVGACHGREGDPIIRQINGHVIRVLVRVRPNSTELPQRHRDWLRRRPRRRGVTGSLASGWIEAGAATLLLGLALGAGPVLAVYM